MATLDETAAGGARRDRRAVERVQAAVRMGARGLMWSVLTVSLFGTALTARFLPAPWAWPLKLVSAIGGIGAGLAAGYHVFFAFLAALGLARFALPGNRTLPPPPDPGDRDTPERGK